MAKEWMREVVNLMRYRGILVRITILALLTQLCRCHVLILHQAQTHCTYMCQAPQWTLVSYMIINE